jgi:DNA-binding NarL/FixJ family response regulator
MSPTRPIRRDATDSSQSPCIVLADDCIATRLGMRVALERDGFVVTGEATTCDDLVRMVLATRPDVCLVDVDLPGGGIVAAQAIGARLAGPIVVMLTSARNGDGDVLAAIRAGALGYLPKTIDGRRLAAVVRNVLAGEVAIPRSMVGRLLDEIRDGGARRRHPLLLQRRIHLTVREWQVVDLMRNDLTTREIATRLGIAEVTVRRHVSEVLRKLGAPDRKTALRLLQRDGAHAPEASA